MSSTPLARGIKTRLANQRYNRQLDRELAVIEAGHRAGRPYWRPADFPAAGAGLRPARRISRYLMTLRLLAPSAMARRSGLTTH
ncbi:hypothetical protein [Chitinimonas sp.]|uniref:hypothetical protein n=1 Tax=Chitinimonas sp. TaxID=1934313 RepID=UPI0035ADC95C